MQKWAKLAYIFREPLSLPIEFFIASFIDSGNLPVYAGNLQIARGGDAVFYAALHSQTWTPVSARWTDLRDAT